MTTGLSALRADFEAITKTPGWQVHPSAKDPQAKTLLASRKVEGGEEFLSLSFAPSLQPSAAAERRPRGEGGRAGGRAVQANPPVKLDREGRP